MRYFFLFFFFTLTANAQSKKIKVEYITTIQNGNSEYNFTEYNENEEPINEGEFKYDAKKNKYEKVNQNKIYTEKELNFKYTYNAMNQLIAKTRYFSNLIKNLEGQVREHQVFLYSNQGKLFRKDTYIAVVDTTYEGRETLNEDVLAFKKGFRTIDIKHIKYNLKKYLVEEYDENGLLYRQADILFSKEGTEYTYNDQNKVVGYSIYNDKDIEYEASRSYKFNIEDYLFNSYNLNENFTLSYKYDEFGNWIEKNVYSKNGELFKKTERHLVYF